jgi:hypothetical protein
MEAGYVALHTAVEQVDTTDGLRVGNVKSEIDTRRPWKCYLGLLWILSELSGRREKIGTIIYVTYKVARIRLHVNIANGDGRTSHGTRKDF